MLLEFLKQLLPYFNFSVSAQKKYFSLCDDKFFSLNSPALFSVANLSNHFEQKGAIIF